MIGYIKFGSFFFCNSEYVSTESSKDLYSSNMCKSYYAKNLCFDGDVNLDRFKRINSEIKDKMNFQVN